MKQDLKSLDALRHALEYLHESRRMPASTTRSRNAALVQFLCNGTKAQTLPLIRLDDWERGQGEGVSLLGDGLCSLLPRRLEALTVRIAELYAASSQCR